MVQTKNPEFLGLLFGSPFAVIGLIFLLRGKFGVGFAFLMLGLAPVVAGTAIGRKAAAESTVQEAPSADGKQAEPRAMAEGGTTSSN